MSPPVDPFDVLVAALADAVADRLAYRLPEPRPAEPEHSPLMTRRETAEHFRVSVATVDRWVRRGAPFLRVGCVKRFDRDALRAWLDSGERRLRVVK